MTPTIDPTQAFFETIVTQIPNFVGLILALLVVLRQNVKLTDTITQLVHDCDCHEEKPPKTWTPNT